MPDGHQDDGTLSALIDHLTDPRLGLAGRQQAERVAASVWCWLGEVREFAWNQGRDAVYVEANDNEIVLCSGANPYRAVAHHHGEGDPQ